MMPRHRKPRFDKAGRRWKVWLDGRQYHLGMDDGTAERAVRRNRVPNIPNWVLRRYLALCDKHGVEIRSKNPTSVAALCETWLSIHPSEHYKRILKDFITFASIAPLAELPVDCLMQFDRWLIAKDNGAQTRRHKLSAASRVLKYGEKMGWLPTLPDIPKPPSVASHPKDIPVDRLATIFEELAKPGRERANRIFRFMLATGCRPGEARNLEWSDVQIEQGFCVIGHHKSAHRGKSRTLYLNPAAHEILIEASSVDGPDGIVFKARTGDAYTAGGLRSILKRLGAYPYQLRHTFAQDFLDQGGSIDDLRGFIGHSQNSRITEVYGQIRARRLLEVASHLTSPLQREPRPQPSDDSREAETA